MGYVKNLLLLQEYEGDRESRPKRSSGSSLRVAVRDTLINNGFSDEDASKLAEQLYKTDQANALDLARDMLP